MKMFLKTAVENFSLLRRGVPPPAPAEGDHLGTAAEEPQAGSRPPATMRVGLPKRGPRSGGPRSATGLCQTSKYRGVTRHRRTQKWEGHIWVTEQKRQVYLGGYDLEEHAASAHDVAAIKLRGQKAKTNFVRSCYDDIESAMKLFTFPEMVMALRRQSTGLAKTKTPFRGVVRSHNGKWEGRIAIENRTMHLGLFESEEEAARAYDQAVQIHGSNLDLPLNFPPPPGSISRPISG